MQKYIKVNPNIILRKEKEDQAEVKYSEDFDEEKSIIRKVCLIPYEPIWYNLVIIIGLGNSIQAMINAIQTIIGDSDNYFHEVFYFGDFIWFVNTTLLVCCKYMPKLKTSQMKIPPRNGIWYIIDYIAILPIELLFPNQLRGYVGLNKTLKIFHIMTTFQFVNHKLQCLLVTRLFQLICQLLYFIILVALMVTAILDWKGKLRYDIVEIINIVADHMTGRGFGLVAYQNSFVQLVLITTTLTMFIAVLLIATANITFLFFTETVEKSLFRYKSRCLKNSLKRMNCDADYINALDIFFDTMWTHADGYERLMGGRRSFDTFRPEPILSRTFFSEITIDMCTGIFKHSILLKDLPVPFLRDLSAYVTQEVYLQNQLIHKLDVVKDQMIYIFKGTVEVLSDEDGESVLIKLTAGTCLSEVCLWLPYRATTVVKCSTACVFHILRRADFFKVLIHNHAIHRAVKRAILARFEDAKSLKKIQLVFNKRADQIKKCTNMCWLITKLHQFTALVHPHAADRHIESSLRLERMFEEERFRRHIFSPVYLMLYTVPEVMQEYHDTLFAKSTFPYIFNANTGLVLFWEMFISLLALIAGLLIPYFTFTYDNMNMHNINSTVYFFTAFWCLDLIIQLRISIVHERRVVSGFTDILIRKLTSIIFILDIYSVIPLELFSGVFAHADYTNFIYMNRILKLARVARLLARWEERYNSNPLIVRFVCATLFMVYSVFIVSCIYYYVAYAKDGSTAQFETLLFYMSQILTGVSVWVKRYSNFPQFQLINTMLYIVVCTIYAVMYGMIFSAYAFLEFHLLHIKQSAKSLITAAKAIDTRYEFYISEVVHQDIIVDKGINFYMRDHIYNALPKEWLAYFYEMKYEAHIANLPIFSGLSRELVRDIFVDGGSSRDYHAHEVIFHIGELRDDVFLLVSGHCQVVCGETLKSTTISGSHELNSVECALMIPMRTTVITLTHCRVVRIRYQAIRRMLLMNDKRGEICRPLTGYRSIRAQILNIPLMYYNPDLLSKCKKEMWMQSVVYFRRTDENYLKVFKTAGLLKVRWLFMNFTLCPQGRLLVAWEIIRCCSAVLSALFFTSITLCFYNVPHPVGIFKWTLEAIAMIDIYIRAHCTYYDDRGVLITHPVKTAKHYAHNALAVDLLGALPLHLGIQATHYVIINVNKLLPLYRYLQFIKYKQTNQVTPLNKLYIFAHFPLMIVLINILAGCLMLSNCTFNTRDPRKSTIKCAKDSLFDFPDRPSVEDPLSAHLYAIYIVLSIVSKIAVQGFEVVGRGNMLFLAILAILGFAYDTLHAAVVFGFFMQKYVAIMHNDIRMKLLKTFLRGTREHNTTAALIRRAEHHIKRVWTLEENNVHKHVQPYSYNLQRDILYNRFAPVLTQCCLLGATDIHPFIRNLLVHSEYKIIDRNGIVHQENDVCGYTIIVFRGIIGIANVNTLVFPVHHVRTKSTALRRQKRVCITLGPGSIVGNLCPLQYNRLKVTVTAQGVLELLYVKTNKFFEIMQHFPSSQRLFMDLRCVHLTHVPGVSYFQYPNQSIAKSQWKITKRVKFAYICLNILNLYGAFVPQIKYFYNIISVSSSWSIYHILADACYLTSIFLVFFLPITDAKGDLMSNGMIIKQYFRPWIFYTALVGAIPGYLIVPDVKYNNLVRFYIHVATRSNVLLRNFVFFQIINKSLVLTPSTIYVVTFFINILITILCIAGTTAFLVIISELSTENMNVNIEMDPLVNASIEEKYTHIITFLYVITNVFTHTSQPMYYPVGNLYICVFIVIMAVALVYNTVFYSMVVSLVQAIHQLKWKYLSAIHSIRVLMRRSNTSSILMFRLNYYCGRVWQMKKGYKIPGLFLELPLYLREPLCEDLYGNIFYLHPILDMVHTELRRQLYVKLKIEHFMHGDYITYAGTIDETMYFVHIGHVVRLSSSDQDAKVLEEIWPGGSFGEAQGVFEHLPQEYSYRATCTSIILYLVKSDWDYMLHFYPASKSVMENIAGSFYRKQKQE